VEQEEKSAMKLEQIAIDTLITDPNNARKHSDKNLKAIIGSLNQFGQRKPIVIDKGNVVIAGNGTLEAARRIGWKELQAVRVPEDWTAEQIKAFALADNRSSELANWDDSILAQQLLELDEHGWDISELGFNQRQLPAIGEREEDELPSTPADATSKLGNVYRLGKHHVICGDSTDAATLQRVLNGEQADIVFTDPPYNVAYEGGTKDKLTIQNDQMTESQFYNFLLAAYQAMYQNSKEGAPIYVCHADTSSVAFRSAFVEAGWLYKQCLIWVKDSLVLSRQDYNWIHEPIIYGWKPGAAHSWFGQFSETTVLDTPPADLKKLSKQELLDMLTAAMQEATIIREPRPRRSSEHPTMKPVNLVTRLLNNSAKKDALVLDPFGGSGSTLIAAEQLNMRAAICELDPKYVDVIIKRWENLTGGTAELIYPINQTKENNE